LVEVGKAVLTTHHAASSYGQPVLVMDGQVRGPGDIPDEWQIGMQPMEGSIYPHADAAAMLTQFESIRHPTPVILDDDGQDA